jgi:nitrate reductase beta subunit
VGLPTVAIDPTTGRMDYLGSVVNKAARVAGLAAGGQTLMSAEFKESIGEEPVDLDFKQLGSYMLKGISGEHEIIQVLPSKLIHRVFAETNVNSRQNRVEKKIEDLIKVFMFSISSSRIN